MALSLNYGHFLHKTQHKLETEPCRDLICFAAKKNKKTMTFHMKRLLEILVIGFAPSEKQAVAETFRQPTN